MASRGGEFGHEATGAEHGDQQLRAIDTRAFDTGLMVEARADPGLGFGDDSLALCGDVHWAIYRPRTSPIVAG